MSHKDYEDIIMKTVHTYFGEAVLPFLGINEPVVQTGQTEIPVLELTRMYMDFTFLTVKDRYLHFEFQSTDGGVADPPFKGEKAAG